MVGMTYTVLCIRYCPKIKCYRLNQQGDELHCACTLELPRILSSTSATILLARTLSGLLLSMQSFCFDLLSNTADSARPQQAMKEQPGGY